MGEVYRAEDLALGRQVAIKILADDLSPERRARFLRETKANASLQHPAIATFYEAGEIDGVAFLALEYVPGSTLRKLLADGPLALERAIAIVAGLLEALAHAHAVGLLHRDIKPENIIVPAAGTPKLLDFGLAKPFFTDPDSDATLTRISRSGMVTGTLGYMSPEQQRGEKLDVRSDLFAVGAVLYEAITGRPAFPGATPAERIAAVLSGGLPPMPLMEIPQQASDILQQALASDRNRRYATTAQFLSDLRQLETGETAWKLPETLAVVDLQNLSGRPDDDWLGSAIAESLATDLARIDGLTVVAPEKVLKADAERQASAEPGDVLDLGLALGCRWLLSGGFQRMGPRLRVTARLTEVPTGTVVFADKVDGQLEDVFAIQDQLSTATSEHLKLQRPRAGPIRQPQLSAYEYYARGRRFYLRYEKGGFDRAREQYERASELEPDYAPALAGLASVLALSFIFSTDTHDLDRAREYAERAIELDPHLAEGRIWLGYVFMRLHRSEEAFEQQRLAMEIDPENFLAPYFGATSLVTQGRWTDARDFFRQAIELNPDYGWSWLGLGGCHLNLNCLAEARWSLEKAAEIEDLGAEQGTAGVRVVLAECLRRTGQLEEARRLCLRGLKKIEKTDHMYRDTMRGISLCTLGRVAFDQNDGAAAEVAFEQAIAHLRGRPRTLGGGYLMIQALVGLARTTGDREQLSAAEQLHSERSEYDFSFFWTCTEEQCALDLQSESGATEV